MKLFYRLFIKVLKAKPFTLILMACTATAKYGLTGSR